MSIGAGAAATCIVNGIGQRVCAGTNPLGQLGSPTTATPNPTPTATVVPSSSVDTYTIHGRLTETNLQPAT
jgi:hypothetical protein